MPSATIEPSTVSPDWLAALPIWLQHREKVPHYSGASLPRRRSGELDRPEDRAALVPFTQLELAKGFEPGYALGPVDASGTSLCGVDLDDCFTLGGKVVEPLKPFCNAMKDAGAMIEVSRSGKGLHLVWLSAAGDVPSTFKRAGVECYTGGRFFARGTKVVAPGSGVPIMVGEAMALLPQVPVDKPVDSGDNRLPEIGERNNYLHRTLVALHAAGLDDGQKEVALLAINEALPEPLDEQEVRNTILKSLGKLKVPVIRPVTNVFDVVEPEAPEPQYTLKPTLGALDLSKKPPPVEHVVEGYAQVGKVGILAAEGATGKTTLLFQMGVCIVTGRPFMGLAVRQGPFVLLSRDDDLDDMHAVLQEVSLAMQLDRRERELVRKNFYLYSLRSSPEFMLIEADGRAFKSSAFAGHMTKALKVLKPVMVAIDTARQFTGVDSTNEAAQIMFMSVCAGFTGCGAAVVIAHHVGKQAAREKIVDMYSAIGSSALADNARFMWRLLKIEPEEYTGEAPVVRLPLDFVVPDGADLLQLISTRGSLRVKRPSDVYYTRREFDLQLVGGKVTKMSKTEAKEVKRKQTADELLEHLLVCYREIGVVGRDKAHEFFKRFDWPMDNNVYTSTYGKAQELFNKEKEMFT